jgi:hypothetical protein
MQYPKIEWEDFADGSGARTDVTIRMLIGDKFGNDERYNKRTFSVAVSRAQTGFMVVMDGNPDTVQSIPRAASLTAAKTYALGWFVLYIQTRWISELFNNAKQTSNPSAIL